MILCLSLSNCKINICKSAFAKQKPYTTSTSNSLLFELFIQRIIKLVVQTKTKSFLGGTVALQRKFVFLRQQALIYSMSKNVN